MEIIAKTRYNPIIVVGENGKIYVQIGDEKVDIDDDLAMAVHSRRKELKRELAMAKLEILSLEKTLRRHESVITRYEIIKNLLNESEGY